MIARGVLLLASLLAAIPSSAAPCLKVADLLANAPFARYPAKHLAGPWHAPDVSRGTAHLFRTRLREDSRGAPDFAGRFKMVAIGCGAGAVCPAIVDKGSGRVAFVPEFRSVSWLFSDVAGADSVDRLTYRRNSRLLVLFGARNEEERSGGVTFYDWRGGRPHLVRFVPEERLCLEEAK